MMGYPMTTCDCGHALTAHQTGEGPWTGFCGGTNDVGGHEDGCDCEAPTVGGSSPAITWPPKDMTPIQEAIHRGRQSVEYTLIVGWSTRRFRVKIERDSYDEQSWAKVDLWTGSGPLATGWVNVASLPWEDAASATYNKGIRLRSMADRLVIGRDVPDVSRYSHDEDNLPRFREDARTLLDLARRIG